MYDYGIENGKLYLDGGFFKRNLYICGEKIAAISTEKQECNQILDAQGCEVLPGFIDPHVHFQLGVDEKVSKDDFYAGSKEGIYGGVTTYIDFLDPVKKAEQISSEFIKRMEAAKNSVSDYTFHTTIANPSSSPKDIIRESKKLGINSVKLFTTYSDTDRRTYDDYILQLLAASREEKVVVVIHAENDDLIMKDKNILVKDHEKSRPAIVENIEVMKLAQIAKETGGNLYFVHVSAGSSVELLARNFEPQLCSHQITLESCPHYFLLNSDRLADANGYKYTMTPPIRPEQERVILNKNINWISTIGTDHCPYTKQQKNQLYTKDIPMGIGGVRYSFLNMYETYGFSILDKFTKGPAKAYGLEDKGSLIPGMDADIVIFNQHKNTEVKDEMSVYDRHIYQGKIETVLVRGSICLQQEKLYSHTGKYIKRGGCNERY